ncbi:MAG: amidohydrolase, partial [Pseudonocardiales bacterium]
MRITLAQVDSRPGELDANVARAEQVIAEAVSTGTDLVVFPELSLSGYTIGDLKEDISIPPDDRRLAKLAKQTNGAGVLLGFPEAQAHGLHIYNSAVYYENGQLVHVHRKLFLPNYATFEERKHFLPGQ